MAGQENMRNKNMTESNGEQQASLLDLNRRFLLIFS